MKSGTCGATGQYCESRGDYMPTLETHGLRKLLKLIEMIGWLPAMHEPLTSHIVEIGEWIRPHMPW